MCIRAGSDTLYCTQTAPAHFIFPQTMTWPSKPIKYVPMCRRGPISVYKIASIWRTPTALVHICIEPRARFARAQVRPGLWSAISSCLGPLQNGMGAARVMGWFSLGPKLVPKWAVGGIPDPGGIPGVPDGSRRGPGVVLELSQKNFRGILEGCPS